MTGDDRSRVEEWAALVGEEVADDAAGASDHAGDRVS